MNFNWLLKLLPLAEGMIKSSIQDHFSAIKELLTTSIFCFLPLFIGALSMVLNAEQGFEIAYTSALLDVVSEGELILYSSSILAPILFLVLNEPEGKRRFRERLFQGTIVTVLIFTCNFLYIMKFTDNVNNLELLVYLSYWLICISVLFWYLATVFKNMMNGGVNLKSSENEFAEGYDAHREKTS